MIEKFLHLFERLVIALEATAGFQTAPPAPRTIATPAAPTAPVAVEPSAVPSLDAPTPAAPAKAKAKVTPAQPASATPTALTLQHATAALRKFVTERGTLGLEEGRKLLAKYGVVRMSDLKPEDFGKIVADIKAAIGEK